MSDDRDDIPFEDLDFWAAEQKRRDFSAFLYEEEEAKREQVKPLEPCRVPTPNTVPVKPGNAAAARRAGCEDEHDNAMQARYGDGW